MGEKGGDKDWYGYCVDDPVNRVDAWGLEGKKTGRGAHKLLAPSSFYWRARPGGTFLLL